MLPWRTPATALAAAAALVFAALPATAVDDQPAGSVATVSIDSFDGLTPSSKSDRVLLTDDGQVLPLATATRPTFARADDSVRALLSDGASGSLAAGSATSATSAASAASATVARAVAPVAERLYLVAIQDASAEGDFSTTRATEIATAAAAYWKREARGGISTITVDGVKAITLDGSCDDAYTAIWETAAAAYPGVDFRASGNHVVAFSPLGCAATYEYAGVANIGGNLTSGGYIQVVADQWGVLAHELGHNFGLGHADLALQTPYDVPIYEYYSLFGPMAAQVENYEPGALDGVWRAKLGLPGESTRQKFVAWNAAPAIYNLAPATAASGTTTLVLKDPSGVPAFYLDYRSGAAADARTYYASDPLGTLASPEGDVAFRKGVTVSAPWVPDAAYPQIKDLVTVAFPLADGTYRAAGRTGDSLGVMGGDVRIKVMSTSSTGTQVLVSYAGNPKVSTTTRISVPAVVEGTKARVSIAVSSATKAATGNVAIYKDGTKVATRALYAGKVTYTTTSGLTRGTHTFTAKFLGTPAFGASSASTKAVAKDFSRVNISATKVRQGVSSTLTARVYSDLTANGIVKIYKGTTYVGKATVTSGKATFHLPKSWKSATYKLTVKYSGSATVASSRITKTVTIH
jgi:hypothetical protein